MFLHIGENIVISLKNVIAILDIETTTTTTTTETTTSTETKEFLKIAEEKGFIYNISKEIPKSFIITEIDKKSKIYFSPILSTTLKKRAEFIHDIANI